MKLHNYYAIWSDNEHRFGSPYPYKGERRPFPIIIFQAKNLKEATEIINAINDNAQESTEKTLTGSTFSKRYVETIGEENKNG